MNSILESVLALAPPSDAKVSSDEEDSPNDSFEDTKVVWQQYSTEDTKKAYGHVCSVCDSKCTGSSAAVITRTADGFNFAGVTGDASVRFRGAGRTVTFCDDPKCELAVVQMVRRLNSRTPATYHTVAQWYTKPAMEELPAADEKKRACTHGDLTECQDCVHKNRQAYQSPVRLHTWECECPMCEDGKYSSHTERNPVVRVEAMRMRRKAGGGGVTSARFFCTTKSVKREYRLQRANLRTTHKR